MLTILIIDDDRMIRRSLELQLGAKGFRILTAENGTEGLKQITEFSPDIVFLDYHMPDITGIDVLEKLHTMSLNLPVILMTGRQEMNIVIDAMKQGAYDYIRKPVDIDDLLIQIEKIKLSREKQTLTPSYGISRDMPENPNEIIGSGKAITDVLKQIGLLAGNTTSVTIIGESGTGKELAARALHQAMGRDLPFVAVNLSAMPDTLIESEMFGYEKGAFTGADRAMPGKMELAGNGVFFLDEISEIPMNFQVKLLRVLQEREFERLGSHRKIPLKARIVSASNRDLLDMVKQGTFREDLYYRLAVATLRMPSLRERMEDLTQLVQFFIKKHGEISRPATIGITEKALKHLKSQVFPGNIRQLENTIVRGIIESKGEFIELKDLSHESKSELSLLEIIPLWQSEKQAVLNALKHFNWNITQTARALEIAPNTLRKKISDYKLKE